MIRAHTRTTVLRGTLERRNGALTITVVYPRYEKKGNEKRVNSWFSLSEILRHSGHREGYDIHTDRYTF